VGFWADLAELRGLWQEERRFVPALGRDEADARLAQWRRAVERARGWAAGEQA
jgi:glycerol kinase